MSQGIFFDKDYLYFIESRLTPERSEQETALICRLLSLSENMTVLDLACGQGRIANRLAKRGLYVAGIDASVSAITKAQKMAREMQVRVNFQKADVRLGWQGEYDAIVSWYTSWGYFDDNVNRKILTNVYKTLKPGGRLLIDHINRDGAIRNGPEWVVQERGKDVMIDHNTFDVHTGRLYRERTFRRGHTIRTIKYFIRLFTFTELAGWLSDVGFSEVSCYGAEGDPYTISSTRMVVVAQKSSEM